MTTITIKVPVTPETEEKEIQLPFYGKINTCFYKIESKDKGVAVYGDFSIGSLTAVPKDIMKMTLVTEAEFQAAFAKTEKKLRALAGIAERATTEA